MAWDSKDLKCTDAEKGKISAALAGIPGWDSNIAPWKQIPGNLWEFIPETVSGSDGVPDAVIMLAKQVLLVP